MADYNLRGWKWHYVDGWAYCKGDGDAAPDLVKQFKSQRPHASVRVFKRDVKAGGGRISLTVVVMREKVSVCTCGFESRGRLPIYLTDVCANCKAKGWTAKLVEVAP